MKTFEQGDLHRRFQNLVDTLLETMTKDIGITEEIFCLAAKKGLREEKIFLDAIEDSGLEIDKSNPNRTGNSLFKKIDRKSRNCKKYFKLKTQFYINILNLSFC